MKTRHRTKILSEKVCMKTLFLNNTNGQIKLAQFFGAEKKMSNHNCELAHINRCKSIYFMFYKKNIAAKKKIGDETRTSSVILGHTTQIPQKGLIFKTKSQALCVFFFLPENLNFFCYFFFNDHRVLYDR